MRKWHGFLILILMLSLSKAASQLPQFSEASPLYVPLLVNDFGDDSDVNPGDGICETGVGTGVCTLRAAIEEANALPTADDITLPAGIYPVANQLDVTDELIINGINNPTIDGGGTTRIFEIHTNPAILTLNTLVLANGDAGGGNGGGVLISVQDGELVLNNSIIQDSAAFDGGAIYNDSGTVTLQNSVLDTNSATNEGGGIYSIVTGIGANSLVNIFDSMLVGNSAVNGGGFLINDSTAVITGSTFTLNTATGQGGAINLIGLGQLDMMNSTISGNTAQTAGGGVSVDAAGFASSANLNHTTLFENTTVVNTAGSGGNIRFDADGTLTVTASIVTGGDTGGDCVVVSGTSTFGENLATIGQCGAADDATNLGPLADNGGPTQTHALLVAGSNAENGVAVCAVGTDQRGDPRTLGGTCDIGAFEATNTPEIQVEDALGNIIPNGGTYVFPAPTFVGGTVTRTLTVRNIGEADLLLDPLTDPPTTTGDFTAGNFGATTIASLDFTTFDLTCNGVTAGTALGAVSFDNDDSDENPFNFDVECVVTATPEPEITVIDITAGLPGTTLTSGQVGVVDFGTTPLNTPITRTFRVANIGTLDLVVDPAPTLSTTVFSFVTPPTFPQTIAPNNFIDLVVQCEETTSGTFTDEISIAHDDNTDGENPFFFPISCDVVAPEIEVLDITAGLPGTVLTSGQASVVDFGNTPINTAVTRTFRIANIGTLDLVVDPAPTLSTTVFSFVTPPTFPQTIAPNNFIDLVVQCEETTSGTFTDEISIAHDDNTDGENPFFFPISCTVVAPEIEVRDDTNNIIPNNGTFNFTFTTVVGTPIQETISVDNIGMDSLAISNLSVGTVNEITVGAFSTGTIASADPPATFDITCDAVTSGAKTRTITFDNDDSDENPFSFTVNCVVTQLPEPEISVFYGTPPVNMTTGDNFDFGTTVEGTSVSQVFTIQNTGTADLAISAASFAGTGFSLVTPPAFPQTLAPAATLDIEVQCDAAAPATFTDTLSLDNDDTTNNEDPFDIALTCIATALEPEIQVFNGAAELQTGDTLDFGSVTVATPITLTITNSGTADLTINQPTFAGTGFSLVTPPAFPQTITFGNSISLTVQCDAAAVGPFNDTLSIPNDDTTDGENPFAIALTCMVAAPEIEVRIDSNGVEIIDGQLVIIDFANAVVGTPSVETFEITNAGTAPLDVSNLTLPGGFIPVPPFPTTVAVGDTATFQVQCDAAGPGTFSGTLSFDNTDTDENPFNFTIRCVVLAANAVDIEVTKGVQDSVVAPGATVIFEIAVRNNGPANATGLSVSDLLPAGLTYLTDNSGGAYNAGSGVWTIGNLNANATITLQLQATATGAPNSDITNTASFLAVDQPEGNNVNDSGTADVHIAIPLVVTKQGFDLNGGTLQIGDTIGWIICAVNPDSVSATNVIVTDTLDTTRLNPPTQIITNTTLPVCPVVAPVAGPAQPNAGGGNISVNIGALAPGATGVVYFETTVRDPGTSQKQIPALAVTGLLAVGGLFLTRMNKRKFLMLVLLLVFIMPASTIYAQGEGETPTEEVTPEPPPLPFTEPTPEPTPIELPFVSPTPTATLTETPTATPSLTETPTATPTVEGQVPPPTSTETPIPTNTVEGVSTSIPTETPVVVTPEVEPSPDEEGWTRYEMSDPRILLSGIWEMIESPNVSGGSYIYTADSNGAVVLEFEGESIRLDYLRFKNFGVFEVYLDEVLVGALSGYSEESDIETTEPFTTTPGIHRLRIQNTQDINNEGKAVLAIDAIEIKGQLLAFSPETPTPIASIVVVPTVEVPTETFTPIATVEGEPTLTPSNTPEIVVIPPDVLPDGQPANTTLPVTEGWTRLEMDHPSINQSGNWKAVESPYVSGGSYIYSTNGSAAVEVTFEGDGLRLDYLQFWNFGIFDVYVDDVHVLTIDGYNSESLLTSSAQLAFSFGTHRLRIQNTGLTNENSDGVVIALDAIDVKNPLTIPTATPVPTNTPNPVNPVEPGWTRYEMDVVTLSGDWQELESNFVTGGSYSYTEEEDATAELEFVGDSIRINYLAFSNFGIFEVFIDDNEVAVVDAFYPESRGAATANFNVAPGVHILRIVNTGRTNGDSGGIGLALDSIDVHEVELPTNTPASIISITGNVVRGEERRPVRQAVLNLYQDDGDEEFDEDELVATVEVVDGLFEFADLEADGIYWILSPDESEMEAVQVTAPSNIEIILPSRPQSDEEVQAEITGRVFNDNNANREWSGSGESGIRDAKVYLYSDDGDEVFDPDVDVEIQNLQVKPDGTYVFAETLPVGVYWIWVDETTLPASYMDTVATGEHGIQNPKLLVIEAEQTGDETPPPTATEEALQPEMTFTADTLIVEKADFAYALDTDNDTSPDSIEGSGDRDNDGIPNYLDTFDPSGVVYSVDAAGNGNALAGATVQLVWDNGGVLTNADTVQPNPQTTGVDGGYRFDIVVGTPNGLPAGIPRTFILQITPPTGFTYPSVTFPPNAGSFDATPTPGSGQIAPFSHPPNTGQLHSFFTSFILQSGDDPVVNNHIAMDAPPTVPLALVVSNQAGASQDNAPVVQSAVVNFPLNSSLNMTFAPNNAQSGSAGQTLTYDHTLTNTGTQSDRYTFTFAAETQTPLWTHEVRILSGATVLGTIAPGGSFTLPAANAVPPNGTLTVRHIVTIPLGTANGAVNVDTITATSLSAAAGGVTLSRTVTDVTTVVSGCLQGTLFHDVNTNNIRDAGEPVFANASVIVTDTVNTPIATLTTDANGNYSLGGLPAGIYNVRVDPASITGGAVIFLNPITGQAQLNVAVGGTCIVGNFSLVLVDPAISKIGSVAQAQPGETITFTLNLTNPSTSPITNVTVVDPLNGLLTFVSATSAQGTSTFNSTTNTVTFSLGTVAPNANILMTVTVTVSSLATPGTTIQNTATLNFAEGPPETSAVVTVTIPSPATATPTASPTVVGGGAAGGGGAGGGGGTGSSGGGGGTGADTLPETGYRPLPAATNLLFGLQLDSLSAMEITLMLLALVVLLGCIGWAVVQWMAEYRSEKLALMLPNRPTRQLIRAVVTIGVVSIMVLSMVFAANINQKPAQKAAPREIADSSDFEGVEADAYLPINWQDAGQQGGFNFAPPEIAAERLIIPRIGIDTTLTNAPLVGRTWDVSGFTNEVAHLDGTAYPGTMGNAVLAGHVQHSEGLGPFRNLDQLSQGDLIIAVGEGVEYTYLITEILEVTPHAVEVTYPSNQPLITLISCTRWDDKSWSYTSRLVVRAKFKSWRNTTEETTQPQGKWTRYEIAEDDVNLDGDWQTVDSSYTSDGGYMYSKDEDAEVTLTFTGEKLRIHYLYFWEFGIFDVYVDDKKVATIDTYNPMSLVGSSEIIFVEPGRHKLRIVNTGEGNAGSQGITIALDAIDVYRVAEK